VIRIARPTANDIVEYLERSLSSAPTYPASGKFNEFENSLVVGHGRSDFDAGRLELERWAMHTNAGVSVGPVPLVAGETVVMWTRTLGLWLLLACRVTEVIDSDDRFGFTYATLPDHPEQGEESFVLTLDSVSEVVLTIRAVSRSGTFLSRAAGPVAKSLQRRYTDAYLNAMKTGIEARPRTDP
jgi:uncharacterized protein (UPF0548 family)